MIKSLILTALLTSGVGANATPLLNNKAETEQTQIVERNNANIFDYADGTSTSQSGIEEIQWTGHSGLTRNNIVTWTSGSLPDKNLTTLKKYTANMTNTASMIKGNAYTQTYMGTMGAENTQLDDIPGYSIKVRSDTGEIGCNTLYAFQYTPYQTINSNALEIDFEMELHPNIFIDVFSFTQEDYGYYSFGIGTQYDIYISTESRWNTYIDKTITQQNNFNDQIINDIKNSANGYNYNQTQKTFNMGANKYYNYGYMTLEQNWIDQGIAIVTDNGVVNPIQTLNIPINPSETNYIIIYRTMYLYMAKQGQQQQLYPYFPNSDPDNQRGLMTLGIADWYNNVYSHGDNNTALNETNVADKWQLTHSEYLTFYGTYVPPIEMEVIDIPGIMFNILSMPFTFVSTAFNLTLFPGTPYQVNIGSIILMLFGLLVFIFLFKIILKVFK